MISPISNSEIIHYIDNEHHTIWKENGIVIGICKPALKIITLKIARQIVKERVEICEGKTHPILADIQNIHRVDSLAKAFFATDEARELESACAIVVGNVFSMISANHYIKVSPATEPARFFTNRKKAFKWLRQFRHLS